MKGALIAVAWGIALCWGAGAQAQGESAPAKSDKADPSPMHVVSTDFFWSTDRDHTDVYRAGINFDLNYRGPDSYWGVRFEQAWYGPLGQRMRKRERGFIRYADKSQKWDWNTQVGTDGRTIIGSAGIHNNAKFRQEYFVERDIVETPIGVDKGIYYTFVGGALDLPIDAHNGFTVVSGVQEFTGKNVRLHARATYTHSIKADWGLSFQLRGRYYHSTHPAEYDYYSPRWYAQILPVLQMRRYSAGWRYMIAGGLGGQRDVNSNWRQSRFLAAEVTTPTLKYGWFFKGAAQYSNTPLRTGIYDYGQFTVSLGKAF